MHGEPHFEVGQQRSQDVNSVTVLQNRLLVAPTRSCSDMRGYANWYKSVAGKPGQSTVGKGGITPVSPWA
jgi:hypothetical protein